ncbi:uncharacterized protein MONBRDRAFT_28199 [Monosiga brevicollis MX1]|uniref:Uncharacterized protein n=1 Tax=Monosiga brevicollis TaxID=81824 RepID=A9V7H5_MONBE|nr:uncharacterized protein MONBRDRAFT_28199 [Monosiga brevicollis MX1]EDQ86514.1 predicted protein [Monosiga brevicollis MX1]|eukprot:XP_001748627.1 hypothetical protein [Monosiga brevicollis MX1]
MATTQPTTPGNDSQPSRPPLPPSTSALHFCACSERECILIVVSPTGRRALAVRNNDEGSRIPRPKSTTKKRAPDWSKIHQAEETRKAKVPYLSPNALRLKQHEPPLMFIFFLWCPRPWSTFSASHTRARVRSSTSEDLFAPKMAKSDEAMTPLKSHPAQKPASLRRAQIGTSRACSNPATSGRRVEKEGSAQEDLFQADDSALASIMSETGIDGYRGSTATHLAPTTPGSRVSMAARQQRMSMYLRLYDDSQSTHPAKTDNPTAPSIDHDTFGDAHAALAGLSVQDTDNSKRATLAASRAEVRAKAADLRGGALRVVKRAPKAGEGQSMPCQTPSRQPVARTATTSRRAQPQASRMSSVQRSTTWSQRRHSHYATGLRSGSRSRLQQLRGNQSVAPALDAGASPMHLHTQSRSQANDLGLHAMPTFSLEAHHTHPTESELQPLRLAGALNDALQTDEQNSIDPETAEYLRLMAEEEQLQRDIAQYQLQCSTTDEAVDNADDIRLSPAASIPTIKIAETLVRASPSSNTSCLSPSSSPMPSHDQSRSPFRILRSPSKRSWSEAAAASAEFCLEDDLMDQMLEGTPAQPSATSAMLRAAGTANPVAQVLDRRDVQEELVLPVFRVGALLRGIELPFARRATKTASSS